MSYSVQKDPTWTVTGPGGRVWSGAPSQRAAFKLATSLAGIDTMLAAVARPPLAVVPDPRPRQSEYGCYPMRRKARK